jgi:hypothetical protein
MQFIKYYSKLLDAQGMPHISIEQHKRLFNIVTIESRIDEVTRLKENERDNDLKYKYETRLFRLKDQLIVLTDNKEAKHILTNMLLKSQE